MFKWILFALITGTTSLNAMDIEQNFEFKDISTFTKKEPIKLCMEETIPDNPKKKEIVTFLNTSKLELVKTGKLSNEIATVKKEVGYTFPNSAPWCLLTTKFIKEQYECTGERLNLGDWGCGNGFFSRHAVLSGAKTFAIEREKEAASTANENIFKVKAFLSDPQISPLYKIFVGSVTKPQDSFMERKNHVNVAFNVLHLLTPPDADLFLQNMFKNTVKGGLAILCCDTPFKYPPEFDYYNQSLDMGVKYPGFGLQNKSNIKFQSNLNKQATALLSMHRPTEQELQEFKMGIIYNGSYPAHPDFDDTKTLFVDDESKAQKGNILKSSEPYYYQNYYLLHNNIDYEALKKVVEAVGFTVINGWYTDHTIDTLYPHDAELNPGSCQKSKVVIVAQKK